MLALVETACLIGPDFSFQSACRQLFFERLLQLRAGLGIAAGARGPGRALVTENEDVFFKLGHEENVSDLEVSCWLTVADGVKLDVLEAKT